eukprot:GHVN01029921.1.p1 GENE.GHVN01029921.1~~GHVN01029921.1.p1  ORF type:complete len:433 (+),score=100.06 GHVN01029921.1:454-1752(+)
MHLRSREVEWKKNPLNRPRRIIKHDGAEVIKTEMDLSDANRATEVEGMTMSHAVETPSPPPSLSVKQECVHHRYHYFYEFTERSSTPSISSNAPPADSTVESPLFLTLAPTSTVVENLNDLSVTHPISDPERDEEEELTQGKRVKFVESTKVGNDHHGIGKGTTGIRLPQKTKKVRKATTKRIAAANRRAVAARMSAACAKLEGFATITPIPRIKKEVAALPPPPPVPSPVPLSPSSKRQKRKFSERSQKRKTTHPAPSKSPSLPSVPHLSPYFLNEGFTCTSLNFSGVKMVRRPPLRLIDYGREVSEIGDSNQFKRGTSLSGDGVGDGNHKTIEVVEESNRVFHVDMGVSASLPCEKEVRVFRPPLRYFDYDEDHLVTQVHEEMNDVKGDDSEGARELGNDGFTSFLSEFRQFLSGVTIPVEAGRRDAAGA